MEAGEIYEELLTTWPHYWDAEKRIPVTPEDEPLLLAKELFEQALESRYCVFVLREDLNVEEALKHGTQAKLLREEGGKRVPPLNWPVIVSPLPHPSHFAVGYSPERDQYAVGHVVSVADQSGRKRWDAIALVWLYQDVNEVMRRLHPGETPDSLVSGPSLAAQVILQSFCR